MNETNNIIVLLCSRVHGSAKDLFLSLQNYPLSAHLFNVHFKEFIFVDSECFCCLFFFIFIELFSKSWMILLPLISCKVI